jgi:hypothetical protein
MNKDEVVQMISDKERELRNKQAEQSLVEENDIKLAKELIVLDGDIAVEEKKIDEIKEKKKNVRLEKKDIELALSKAGHTIKRIQSELRELKNEYWKPS